MAAAAATLAASLRRAPEMGGGVAAQSRDDRSVSATSADVQSVHWPFCRTAHCHLITLFVLCSPFSCTLLIRRN
jgi:hypothetical protein